ncbi:MAG: hypothetical protein H6721_06970 [Sandaracinus sp.]|nr:hypothetical protein [Sandaracinus sp.]MCB9620024.1 hypothetical protein [Sandaracinus sp.]MCB9631861.1 hypothetical protein [Sandaracinus sp.]
MSRVVEVSLTSGSTRAAVGLDETSSITATWCLQRGSSLVQASAQLQLMARLDAQITS